MACGVQATVAGQTLACNNSGSTSHTGPHTATLTITAFGRTWASITVQWRSSDTVPHRAKPLVVGDDAL